MKLRLRMRSPCWRIFQIATLGRRFAGGSEQFCPRFVGRFDNSGHFERRAGLKRVDGRDGLRVGCHMRDLSVDSFWIKRGIVELLRGGLQEALHG